MGGWLLDPRADAIGISSVRNIEWKPVCSPGMDRCLFFLPPALCGASLCSPKVLACVEVSLTLPSVPLSASAPTLTLQHVKGRAKGGWENVDMRRRPCSKDRANRWLTGSRPSPLFSWICLVFNEWGRFGFPLQRHDTSERCCEVWSVREALRSLLESGVVSMMFLWLSERLAATLNSCKIVYTDAACNLISRNDKSCLVLN